MALVHVAAFAKLLFLNPEGVPYALIPWDFATAYQPWLTYTADCLRAGTLPLWNPHIGAGTPFFVNPQSQMYSPLTVLVGLVFGYSYRVAQIQSVFTLLAGGYGAYALSHRLWRNRWAALVSGLAYQLTSAAFGHMEHMTTTNSFAVIPWLFLFADEAVDEKPHRLALPALSAGIFYAIVSGYPGVVFMAFMWLVLYVVFAARRNGTLSRLPAVAAAGALGLAMAAILWMPVYFHAPRMNRGAPLSVDAALATVQGLTFKDLWGTIFQFSTVVPFPGTMSDNSLHGVYFGALALPLAWAALAFLRERPVFPAAILCLGGFLMACGGEFFLRSALHVWFDFLNLSRFPGSDSQGLAVLGGALLAGGGARLLSDGDERARDLVLRGCLTLLGIFVAALLLSNFLVKKDVNAVISDGISAEILFLLVAVLALRHLEGGQRMAALAAVLVLELGTAVLFNFAQAGGPTDDYQKLEAGRRLTPALELAGQPRSVSKDCLHAYVDKSFCADEYNPGGLLARGLLQSRGFAPFLSSGARVVALPPGFSPDTWDEMKAHVQPVSFHVREFEANRARYELDLPASAQVVFNEMWFPGWRAKLDGASVPVREVAGGLRGIDSGSGHHTIEMEFRPRSFLVGAAVSGFAFILWLYWLLRRRAA
jgi:hypothetical protein